MDSISNSDNTRKLPLEELSQEELVKKCRTLLVIAQKARQAKDTLQEENDRLKTDSKSLANDASVEIIESLTQQKLSFVTTIEDLKKQNTALSDKLQLTLQELCASEEKCNVLDNENVSFKRQIKRLTNENEQLITDLDLLEKQLQECKMLGLEQQNQLLVLEDERSKSNENENIELQKMLSISLEEVKKLKEEKNELNSKMASLEGNLSEKGEIIQALNEDYQRLSKTIQRDICENIDELNLLRQALHNNDNTIKQLTATNKKLKDKVKLYHSKIVKFAGNVKVLKQNKNEILDTLKTYTDQVEDWKIQLLDSSQKLISYIQTMERTNEVLIVENRTLKENNAKFIKQLEAHKTDDEKSKDIAELEAIRSENSELIEKLNLSLLTQDEYKQQLDLLLAEKDNQSTEMRQVCEKHQEEVEQLNATSRKHSEEIQNHIDENDKLCLEYRKVITKLEEELAENHREIGELKTKNAFLQEECEHSKSTEKQFAEKTSEEIMKLVQENTQLCEQNLKLIEKTSDRLEISTQTQEDNETEINTNLKRDNSELLNEMNEMNQALKERGETISKLQAHCEEIQKKIQLYETKANKNIDNITQKDQRIESLELELQQLRENESNGNVNQSVGSLIEQKDGEIKVLRAELEQLSEKLNGNSSMMESSYAESETMSTSTISRADESGRLKDLEGSWEERYGKLRNLAIKLKGKVRDVTNELIKEQADKGDIQAKLALSTKTVTSLQSQCDNLQDELEKSQTEARQHLGNLNRAADDLSKDKQKQVANEEQLSSLRSEIDALQQEKAATVQWKKQVSAKIQAFRKETEAHKILKTEFETNIAKLTADLDAKEQALKVEIDKHKHTKGALDQLNNEQKKTSVLNLEMQDYERSVKELSAKLELKKDEIVKLRDQVDSQKSTIKAIREQNRLHEEQVEEMRLELETTKSEVSSYKSQITDLNEALIEKDGKVQSVQKVVESIRLENEELSTELSKVIVDHQNVIEAMKVEKDYFRSQMLGLQQSLRETQDTLSLKEQELGSIQDDYDSYKVRAQSVLRQNQSRDVGFEEKLNEELGSLKIRCESLEVELKQTNDMIDLLKKKNSNLESEKGDVLTKVKDAMSECESIRGLYDQLTTQHQQTLVEHAETVRNLKIHAETLSQCYRQQISEQEVRHNREVIDLQSKIEKAPTPTELTLPLLPTMHREEGEGSESTESVNKSLAYPVPLERLLGSDQEQELMYIKKQLSIEEIKVVHLTELLADTEQDLAKHTQMNKMLKEEIRRQQRSVEREKHAENLEYLKNVVFKFVTLHSGDERTRLVPVLNTILKLSPEESQKLSLVAKGEPGLRAWSNYLPNWPSTSKP